MPARKILSVGQCGYDGGRIRELLRRELDADVEAIDTHDEAIAALRDRGPFDLMLVNRVGDADGAPGLELIRKVKSDADLAEVPAMLVSNLDDPQRQAVDLGALRGFGKDDLGTGKEIEIIRSVLGDS